MSPDGVVQASLDGPGDIGAAARFARLGYLEAGPLLTAGQCGLLLKHLKFRTRVEPAGWPKGRAVTDRLFYDIATGPRLLGLLRPLLGDDVILWGASTVTRRPGQMHAWHVDIESASPGQRFATVWIGLSNTCRDFGLGLVSGSHRFPRTVQEIRHARLCPRDGSTDETVLAWAREIDPSAELVQPDVRDGDGIIFDGRIWHGSLNRRDDSPRTALLLQYASADAPVLKPVPTQLEWPFRFDNADRPPVILVSGTGNGGGNLQVPPPATSPDTAPAIVTEARPVTLPLDARTGSSWTPHPLFSGLTGVHDAIGCHASVLGPGRMPHPPHSHIEEEILVVLDGEAELLTGDGPEPESAEIHPVRPGMFAYYPAYQHHSLRNSGDGPLTYLMFKWRGVPAPSGTVLQTVIVDSATEPADDAISARPYRASRLLDGPTNYLGKLHAHLSEVAPGGGYEPHSDPYDVAIVILSGEIEITDRSSVRRIGPFGVVYYAAGEPHGLRSAGPGLARYLVFEFHGPDADSGGRKKIRGATPGEARTLYRRLERLTRRFPRFRRRVPKPLRDLARSLLH